MNNINFEDILLAHFLNFDNVFYKKSNHQESPFMYLFSIENSIHYQAILNRDFSFYNEYVINTNQTKDNHTVENFKKLLEDFDLEKMEKIQIKYIPDIKKYRIIDGCHRISCMFLKQIPLKLDYFEIIN